MEIDFNLGRIPKPELRQAIDRPAQSPAASDAASFPSAASLKSALNDTAVVRPEKVEQAKALATATSYPPTELLNRIAILLAVHLKH
jgi:hypothetical protein